MKAWKIRSGGKGNDVSDAFWDKGVAAIGWGLGDLSGVSNREEISAKLRAKYPEWTDGRLRNVAGNLHRFVNEMEVGDLILTPPTENRDFLIGRCQSQYNYRPGLLPEGYEDVREVNWLRRIPRSGLSEALRNSCNGEITVSSLSNHADEIAALIGQATNTSNRARWNNFVKRAEDYVATGRLESDEIEYKVETGRKLAEAREAVLSGEGDWASLVRRGIASNTIHNVQRSRFLTWIDDSPEDALAALRAIWTTDDLPLASRIRSFNDLLPASGTSREGHPIGLNGVGTRMNFMSVLLMGLDAEQYPPFRVGYFGKAYERTGYAEADQDADEATLYKHALAFLDRFIDEAAERRLTLRHRLDAQSVMWAIKDPPDEPEDDEPEPVDAWSPESVASLAENLLWKTAELQKVIDGLKDKKQVIFQGPPGTGKTYVAKRIAEWCRDHGGDFQIVQFHPSYSYEDFVEGFRPTLSDGQAGFELAKGPLRRIARQAEKNKDSTFILVIDEINRGNVAKVLGELYFLLEYRNESVGLQYSNQQLSLPENLWFIGTMNTTDRSIALVDAALRRRFYFFSFFPDEPPIRGLLDRWLDRNNPDAKWVSKLVDIANAKLKDRHLTIGPSHFMKNDPPLDKTRVRFIWEQAVIPYIEEQFFGKEDLLKEFAYDELNRELNGNSAVADSTTAQLQSSTDAGTGQPDAGTSSA